MDATPRPIAAPDAHHLQLILRLFLLSGAAGLIYEVVWARQLVLVFGNTTQAISAILTGYFGGMALGSILGGRLADRVRSPLRLYGVLELVLVAVVLVTPLTFRLLHEVYRGAYGALETMPTALALVRFGLALLALGPATVLMGATLPALTRQLTRRDSELSLGFGRLYAANTLGALVGAQLAGFILIELLGLMGTLIVGAICSGAAGLAAVILARREPRSSSSAGPPGGAVRAAGEAVRGGPAAGWQRPTLGLALCIAAVSGLASLGYQVLWTRLLSSGVLNTTYIFTAILSIFLLGIVVGAYLFARFLTRVRAPLTWLAGLQLAVAALALGGLLLLGEVVEVPFALKLLAIVLPATLVMGVTFPLASRLLDAQTAHVGRDTGLLLGANTLGAISGTFLVPFVLIPLIGSPRTVALLAAVNAALALSLLVTDRARLAPARASLRAATAMVLAAAVVATAVPNPLVVDPGVTRLRRDGVLLHTAEDEIASVQAGILHGNKQLFVAGTSMTVLSVNMKLMAYLPQMLRPHAQSMLVIAFGMGSTYRSALLSGLTVDGAELVPSVPAMFPQYFADAAEVLAHPRGHLHITDGRNFVELTDRRFDLVVSDPPPPMENSGTGVLYSREFYEAVRDRMSPDGVVLQLIGAEQSVEAFRDHVRTFTSVFPHTLLLFETTGQVAMFLVGSQAPMAFESMNVQSVLARPGVLDDLRVGIDASITTPQAWEALIHDLVWLTDADARRFAGSGPLITDDRPLPEYFLLRRALAPGEERINRVLLESLAPAAARQQR